MTSLAARAEVMKLARELHTAPADLGFLLESDPVAIRRVRQAMYRSLDAPHRPMLRLVAKVSGMVPNTLAIAIATRFFGPMLCGMVASSLSPERAVSLIGQVPVEFLADVAQYVDPEAATPIVRRFDVDVLVPVLREMLRRKDYVTLARFVVAASEEQLVEIVPYLDSGAELLMVAFDVELDAVSDRFEPVMASLPESRIRDILQAAYDGDLFAETLTFLPLLSDKTLTRIADVATSMGPELLEYMVLSTQRENAWAELLPVASAMSQENLPRLLELDVWTPENLAAILAVAENRGRSEQLDRIIAAVTELLG